VVVWKEKKIKNLIETMKFVVDHVSPKDNISIISFNNEGYIETPLSIMDENNRNLAKIRINALRAGGGTCINNGLYTAFDDYKAKEQTIVAKNSVTAILLLTDGQDSPGQGYNSVKYKNLIPSKSVPEDDTDYNNNSDPYAPVLQLAEQFHAPIHCFGFGSDHDAKVLNHLASKSGGVFAYIENIDQVGDAFAATLGSLISTITKDMILHIRVPQPSRRVQPLGRSTIDVDTDPAPDQIMDDALMNMDLDNQQDDPMNNYPQPQQYGGGIPPWNRYNQRSPSSKRKNGMMDYDDKPSVRIVEAMDPQDQFMDEEATENTSSTTTTINESSTVSNTTNNGVVSLSSSTSDNNQSSVSSYPIVGGTMISNVRTAYRSILKADGTELIIHFGSISAGEKREILLTLRFPDVIFDSEELTQNNHGIKSIDHFALQAVGRYITVTDNKNCVTPVGKLIVSRIYGESNDNLTQHLTTVSKSMEVQAACLRDISTKSMKRALKAADHGDYTRARTTLSTAIEQITHSPAYTNGNTLVRGLATDLQNLQSRVSNSYSMEAGGRAAVLSSVSSHLLQRSSGITTPGMVSSAVYCSRAQTEMMMFSPTTRMKANHVTPPLNTATVSNNNNRTKSNYVSPPSSPKGGDIDEELLNNLGGGWINTSLKQRRRSNSSKNSTNTTDSNNNNTKTNKGNNKSTNSTTTNNNNQSDTNSAPVVNGKPPRPNPSKK